MAVLPAYNTGGNWRSGAELGEEVIIANANEWQQKANEAAVQAEEYAQSAIRAESRGDMEVASILWGDSWSYDQKAQNYSTEATRYEQMLPNSAPTPVFTAPGTAPKPKITTPGAERAAATMPMVTIGSGESAPAAAESTAATPTGTYADREALELQIANLQSEMQAYTRASGGKGDPQVLIWYANQIHDAMKAMETLPTEATKFAPNLKNRLEQMGNSATSDIVGAYIQTAATVTEGLSQYASTEGSLEELNVTLAQLIREYDSYLSAGIPESNLVVVQLKDAIDNTTAQIEYVQSGRRGEDTANARQELYSLAGEYYDTARAARDNAVEGLDTVGQIMVDAGIEGLKLLFDQGIGMITDGQGTASALLRSFGDGAYESAEAGWGVQKQIGDGLKSSATEYLMGRFVDKDGVLDKLDDGLIKKIANSIGGNEELIEQSDKVPVNMLGVYLTTFMFACAETIENNVLTNQHNRNDTQKVMTDAINNFISSSVSYIPQFE